MSDGTPGSGERRPPAWLVLEDGTVWPGVSVGAPGEAFGTDTFHQLDPPPISER